MRFVGKINHSGLGNATIVPLINAFPNDLTPANLEMVRTSEGIFEMSLALTALLNDDKTIVSIWSKNDIDFDEYGAFIVDSDDFKADIVIEKILF